MPHPGRSSTSGCWTGEHRYAIWRDSSPRFLALEFIGRGFIPVQMFDNQDIKWAEALEISHRRSIYFDKLHTRVQRTLPIEAGKFLWKR